MKKPITIIIVMIILTMIIGFERIGRGLWFLISDNRTERARSSEASAKEGNENSQVDSLPRLREDGQTHSPARHSESPHTAPEQASQSAFVPGGAPVAIDVTGDLSSMHYIRSSEITGTSEISAKEIERGRANFFL